MTDKELKDWCKTCNVEPPAMKFKCPECKHNEDKEQIIIDGVDVSKCVSFDKLNGQNICCYDDTREDKIPFANFCVENKDCNFKQLARKTAECEELKAQLETYSKMLDNPEFRIALTDVKTGEREVWRKLGRKADRYRKALEEIEGLVSKVDGADECSYGDFNCSNCDDDCTCPTKVKRLILDIINKAKGE